MVTLTEEMLKRMLDDAVARGRVERQTGDEGRRAASAPVANREARVPPQVIEGGGVEGRGENVPGEGDRGEGRERLIGRGNQDRSREVDAAQSQLTGQGDRNGMGRIEGELMRRMEEMERRLAGGRAPLIRKGTAFSDEIMEEELPADFKMPTMVLYEGTPNLEEHLTTFQSYAILHRYSDAIQCRVFLTTLVRSAQQWFCQPPPSSIHTLTDFESKFLHQFSSALAYNKTPMSLFTLRQRGDETLREYFHRFSKAVLDALSATPELKMNALMQGLRWGSDLFKSLAKKPMLAYDELLGRIEKYIGLEDLLRAKMADHAGPRDLRRDDKLSRRERARMEGMDEHRLLSGARPRVYNEYNPLRGDRLQHLLAVEEKNVVQWPAGQETGPKKERSESYCRYHNKYGHHTKSCPELKDEIERLVREGYLQEFVIRVKKNKGGEVKLGYPSRQGGAGRQVQCPPWANTWVNKNHRNGNQPARQPPNPAAEAQPVQVALTENQHVGQRRGFYQYDLGWSNRRRFQER